MKLTSAHLAYLKALRKRPGRITEKATTQNKQIVELARAKLVQIFDPVVSLTMEGRDVILAGSERKRKR